MKTPLWSETFIILLIVFLLVPIIVISIPTDIVGFSDLLYNNSNISLNYFIANVSYSETYPDTCLFSYYNSSGANYTMTKANLSSPAYCWYNASEQSEGNWNFSVYINDTDGNLSWNGTWFLRIDLTPPQKPLNLSPTVTNDTNLTVDYAYVNFTFAESYPDSCILNVYNGSPVNLTVNKTFNNTGGYCEYNLTNQLDGHWNFSMYVNDTAGNLNQSDLFTFRMVGLPPMISLDIPTNTTYNSTTVMINYTVTDPFGVNATWYEFNYSNVSLSGNTTFTAFVNSSNNFTLWSNDSLGNLANTTVFFFVDTEPPSITLNSPSNNFNTSTNPVTLNFTVIDDYASSVLCILSLDGSHINTTTADNASPTIFYQNVSEMPHTWRILCRDEASSAYSSIRDMNLDYTYPTYVIYSPLPIYYSNRTDINFTFYVNDTNLNRTYYSLNNWSNITVSSNGTFDAVHGENYIRFNVYDSMGNLNSTRIDFTVDEDTPVVTSLLPSNGSSWVNSRNVYFYYNVSDLSIANCTLVLSPGDDNTTTTVTINTTQYFMHTLSNGYYGWRIRCEDHLGRHNTSEWRYVTVSYTPTSSSSVGSTSSSSFEVDTDIYQTRLSQSWDLIRPNSPSEMLISNSDIPVTKIRIFANGTSEDVTLYVEKLNQSPRGILAPAANVYKYLNLTSHNLVFDNTSNIILFFQVKKSWFSDNNLDVNSLTFNRYYESVWNKLPTHLYEETSMYYLYNATSPGFSIFSISAEKISSVCTSGSAYCFNDTLLYNCSKNELEWLSIECPYGCDNTTKLCYPPIAGNCSINETKCQGKGLWECVNSSWHYVILCENGCFNGYCGVVLEDRQWNMIYLASVASVASIAIAVIWIRKIKTKFVKKKSPIPEGYPYYPSTPNK